MSQLITISWCIDCLWIIDTVKVLITSLPPERIELSTPCYKTNTLPLSYRGSNLNWQGALIYQHYGKTNLPKCARYIMFYCSDFFFNRAPCQLLIKKFSWRRGGKITGDAEDWTRGLIHAKHVLYHWATSPLHTIHTKIDFKFVQCSTFLDLHHKD